MAGAGWARRVAGAVTAIAVALLPLPASASGPGAVSLASGVHSVTLDDLDGDGTREVIALLAAEREPAVIEAWTHADGSWRSLGRLPIPVIGVEGRTRASPHLDGMGLLTIRDGVRPETLLFAVPDAVALEAGEMQMHAVELREGRLALRPVADALGPIEQVDPIDVDGDGQDELVAFETVGTAEREVSPVLLRRSGPGWTSIPLALPGVPGDVYLNGIADTDGVPGSEIFVAGGPENFTWRVAIDPDGSTHVDRLLFEGAAASAWPQESTWVAGSIGGRALVIGSGADLATATWDRGSRPRIERRLETEGLGEQPFVIGSGEHQRVVVIGPSEIGHGPMRVLDRDLAHVEARMEADPLADDVWELLNTGAETADLSMLYPQLGPIAYGLGDGGAAVWLSGAVAWVDADGRLRTEPARPLLGVRVIGSAGPDDAWLALAGGWPMAGNVFLRPMGGVVGEANLAVAPRGMVIGEGARSADAGIGIERLDGRDVVDAEGVRRVASSDEGFQVRVSGPVRSLVVVRAGSLVQTLRLTGEPIEVTVRPSGIGRRDREYRALMVVVTPSGFARQEAWDALAVVEGPKLTASAVTVDGELAAIVRGQVEQTGGEVVVDGRAVEVTVDGSFEVRVDALPWPRGVDVVSRDILGVEARARVDVLGLVDYRDWPWAAVVAVLTVGAGLLLYVRTPGGARHAPASRGDEGELEEIPGD